MSVGRLYYIQQEPLLPRLRNFRNVLTILRSIYHAYNIKKTTVVIVVIFKYFFKY